MTAFTASGYWLKAKLFLNRAMEPTDIRSEDEKRIWASLGLELMAKWALAKSSPLLVADPVKGDGQQLFMALGIKDGPDAIAITATTAFKRCEAIYPPFKCRTAELFSWARNEYLHGTEVAVLKLPDVVWWSQFWSLVNTLLIAHDREPKDLVGSAHEAEVSQFLAQHASRVKEQYEALITAARRNLARHQAGTMTVAESKRWDRGPSVSMAGKYEEVAECPACREQGTVVSDVADATEIIWPDAEYDEEPSVEVTFTPDFFSCQNCNLVLIDQELVTEAGLATSYVTQEDYDVADWEPDYGND